VVQSVRAAVKRAAGGTWHAAAGGAHDSSVLRTQLLPHLPRSEAAGRCGGVSGGGVGW